MKKLMLGIALATGFAYGQTNDVSSAPMVTGAITVAPQTVKVRLLSINIASDVTGKVRVSVTWQWTDAVTGKVVRSGVTQYTEAQLDEKLAAYGTTVAAFKSLFLAVAAQEAVAP